MCVNIGEELFFGAIGVLHTMYYYGPTVAVAIEGLDGGNSTKMIARRVRINK